MENELNAESLQDATYTADVDDEDYTLPADEESEDDEVVDDDQTDNDKEDNEVAELKTQIAEQQKEINRLGYALRKNKPDEKKEKETPFTEQQLVQLMREHHDDPDVMFQIVKEMTKQGTADAKMAAEKSIDIKNKKGQIDEFILQNWPDAKKEGSELYHGIQDAIAWAHLDGHPMAEQLAFGLLMTKNLPQTISNLRKEIEAKYEKTSKQDLENKAEEARKKKIKEGKSSKSGAESDSSRTAASLTPGQLDTAKRMGFTTKEQLARYAKILNRKGETVHAEA